MTEKFAKVTARGEVCNSGTHAEVFDVVHQLSFEGQVVATETQPLRLEAGQRHELNQELMVAVPKLWGIGQGHLYQLTLTLFDQQQAVIDDVTINCGIRQFEFDKDNGFFLNGENNKIKGVCLHHDTGLFGAAATQRVWERRLAKLMSCGVNAVRSAHNPSSKALLNACDRLGILMQDELFDEWDYPKDKRLNKEDVHSDYRSRGSARHFYQWGQADAEQVVKSHRHHASIFMWSIGNEIEWTYPRNKDATGFFDAQATGNYFWELPPHSPEQIAERLETLPSSASILVRLLTKSLLG
ncbi:beta-galactosidase [Vibrio variabilis]|uniref:Beta-galactosidase n=1 Tax=Vibrio variabilis TaxID=990271 RepID=A0ABQ0JEU1_9VIBR|nr:beta-galactosidase [Vibrio variabilis]